MPRRPQEPGQSDLVTMLRRRASELGDEVLYRIVSGPGEERSLSYAELDERARSIGASLLERGCEGQRVLLVFWPGLDFIEAFFGCLYAGATAVPLMPPRPGRLEETASRLGHAVADADAALLMTDDPVEALLEEGGEALGAWVRQLPRASASSMVGGARGWRRPDVGAETLAMIQYTSGSTGAPKGVMLSHANLLQNQSLICEAFGHRPELIRGLRGDFGVTWLPLFHDMGLIGHVLQPLYIGAASNFMSPLAFLQRPSRWLQAISRFGAHTSGGPDFAYQLCARKVSDRDLEALDLSSWKVAYTGSEPVRQQTIELFTRRFEAVGFDARAFYPTYGLAEATLFVAGGGAGEGPETIDVDAKALANEGMACVVSGESPRRTLVSCGWAHLDTGIRVVDPDTGAVCPEATVGEVWVSGPSCAQGYWRQEEASAQTFGASTAGGEGPYLRTGDLGFIHEHRLFITGRLKEVIILGGRNHHPHDIEDCVAGAHTALRPGGAAAFGVDGPAGERLVVLQELREGTSVEEHSDIFCAMRRALLRREGLWPHVMVLVKARALPKTSSGKARRGTCRGLFQSQGLVEVAKETRDATLSSRIIDLETLLLSPPAHRLALLEESLCAALAEAVGVEVAEVSSAATIDGLGLDSIAVTNLLYEIDQRLGVELDTGLLQAGAGVAELARGLYAEVDRVA